MSYSTQQALDITDSFSYLLTTNAASAERGANAIGAYTKSIQSSRVESESWQSIMAATPTIVDAIAKASGKTAAEVRRLGVTGQLAIQDLNEGLRQTVDLNKQAAAAMSATVKDAITRLTNTWTAYVGEANRASQATSKIVWALDQLSKNLDTVVHLAVTAGEVMVAVWGVKALTALKAYTAQLAVAASETSALMASTAAAGAKTASALAAAGKLAASAWIGWEIGTFLRSEFEVVEKAGIALAAGLTKTAARAQGAMEMIAAAFTDDTIAAAQERMAKRLAEIDSIYGDMFVAANRTAAAQAKAATATEASGQAAGNAAVKWAQLTKDYERVNEYLEQQAELLQRTIILRNAEAATAVELATAFGTEREQREAQAAAAQVQAEQAKALAQQRTLELNVLIAERDAIAAVGAELLKTDPAKQKELADLDRKIALRQAEAGAAVEQAKASQIAATRASAEAEALRDNSGRVDELRIAYEKARAALEAVRAAKEAGKATTEEVTQAEQAAGRAALLYRDALNDQVQAINAKAQAEQASRNVQEMAVRVTLEQQKALYEIAKARGDEIGAMNAQNEIRKLEIELLKLSAEAKRAEAKAQLASIEAQRAALVASGQLTEQKKLELDASVKAAQVKEKEAQIADITADKLRQLGEISQATGLAAGNSRSGYEAAAGGMNRMADAADRLNSSLERQAELAPGGVMVDERNGVVSMNASRSQSNAQSTQKSGDMRFAANDFGSLTAIKAFLKAANVDDDKRAEEIAFEFSDGHGNIPYFNNPGQMKYGGKGSTISQALLKAAEQYTFGVGGDWSTPRKQSAASTSASSSSSAPTASSRTVTVNLNLNGQNYGAIKTDDQGASAVDSFIKAIEDAKRAGGH